MSIIDLLLQAEGLFAAVSLYLNKIVIALVIVLFGFIIGKITESVLRKLLAKMDIDDKLTRLFKARRNYARAIRRTVVRMIYIATVIIALDKLSLVRPVFVMLMFLAIVVIIISFVLAGIDIIPNIMARAQLRSKRIVVGDEIVVTDRSGVIQGTIVDITLTDVHIKRRNGDLFLMPNSVFLRESMVKKRRNA
jgi:small-conductance mechanosensitive channel